MLKNSLPVCIPYLLLGATFGVLFAQKGGTVFESFLISVFTFAGAAQFVSLEYYETPSLYIAMFGALLILNFRHVVYVLLVKNKIGKKNNKFLYIVGAMTDENYGMLEFYKKDKLKQSTIVKVFLLNHSYWVIGCTVGAILGSMNFTVKGLDFFLVALFLILMVEGVKELKSV